MMAWLLFYKQYGHWLKWAAAVLLLASLWLYVGHLQASRDAAVHTAQSLQFTLDDERKQAAGVLQLERDRSSAASNAATLLLVQKKREIATAQTELKREIKYVYLNKNTDAACFAADFKRLWNAANTSADGVRTTAAP